MFLELKKCDLVVQIGTKSSSSVLLYYLEHSPLPPGMQTQSRASVYYSRSPVVDSRGYTHQPDLTATCMAFPAGGLPQNHPQPLSFSWAECTVGILCFTGGWRNMSKFSPSLHH